MSGWRIRRRKSEFQFFVLFRGKIGFISTSSARWSEVSDTTAHHKHRLEHKMFIFIPQALFLDSYSCLWLKQYFCEQISGLELNSGLGNCWFWLSIYWRIFSLRILKCERLGELRGLSTRAVFTMSIGAIFAMSLFVSGRHV